MLAVCRFLNSEFPLLIRIVEAIPQQSQGARKNSSNSRWNYHGIKSPDNKIDHLITSFPEYLTPLQDLSRSDELCADIIRCT